MTARKYKKGDNDRVRGKSPAPSEHTWGFRGVAAARATNAKTKQADEDTGARPDWMDDPSLLPKAPPPSRSRP